MRVRWLMAPVGAAALAVAVAPPCHGGGDPISYLAQSRRVDATAFVDLEQVSDSEVASDFGDFDALAEASVFIDKDCQGYASASQQSMLHPGAAIAHGEVVATREFDAKCTSGASASSLMEVELGFSRHVFLRMRGEVAGGSASFTLVQISQKGMPVIRHQTGGAFHVAPFDDLFTLQPGSYTLTARASCNATGGACGWYDIGLSLAGDSDGDGHVNGADLDALLAGWGACPEKDCDTDIDSSGATGFPDLLLLLTNWTD
jgi:hypothetical protein